MKLFKKVSLLFLLAFFSTSAIFYVGVNNLAVAGSKPTTVSEKKTEKQEVEKEKEIQEAGKYPTVDNPMGFKSKYSQQFELAEYEKQLGYKLIFHENPMFAKQVEEGKLPPVGQRLPEEPLVVIPYHEIGKYGGTLRGCSRAAQSGTTEIMSWRMANLVRLSDDLHTIVPNVAKSWKWNEDYSEITFTLRKGHKWSDGKPFTSDDVVFFINDILKNKELYPKVPSEWNIGGKPVEVEKIDDVTFKFIFAKPFPGYLYSFWASGYNYPFAPKHYLKQFHPKYNPDADKIAKQKGFDSWVSFFKAHWSKWTDEQTSSPYGFHTPTLESHILMEEPNSQRRIFIANPYYFKVDTAGNQLPYIDKHYERFIKDDNVYIMELMKGNLDEKAQNVGLRSYPILKKNMQKGNYTVQLPPGQTGAIIAFNLTHKDPILRKIYGDIRFREAMSLAINREEISKTIYLGLAKPAQVVPRKCSFVTKEDEQYMIEYNPKKANELLDEMGLTKRDSKGIRLRPDGKPLTILWEYSSQMISSDLVTIIAGYWKKVGVNVVTKEITTEALRIKAKNNDLDINNEYDIPYEIDLITQPFCYVPPYLDYCPLFGVPWIDWLKTNGAKGEEPPEWIKRLNKLANEMLTAMPGSKRYMEIGKEMVHINLTNLTIIGTCGDRPNPTVVSNRLGNVTKWTIQNYAYRRTCSFRPDQWFFKE